MISSTVTPRASASRSCTGLPGRRPRRMLARYTGLIPTRTARSLVVNPSSFIRCAISCLFIVAWLTALAAFCKRKVVKKRAAYG